MYCVRMLKLTRCVRYEIFGMFWLVTNRKLIPAKVRMNDSCKRFWVRVGSTANVVNAKILSKFWNIKLRVCLNRLCTQFWTTQNVLFAYVCTKHKVMQNKQTNKQNKNGNTYTKEKTSDLFRMEGCQQDPHTER